MLKIFNGKTILNYCCFFAAWNSTTTISVQLKLKLIGLLLPVTLLLSSLAFAQDPPQYGTPFPHVPSASDAVIYQVNMRAFSADGNFQGVSSRLDNIKALGVNVVYLMPIYPVGLLKGINSPYAITDYKGIAEEFGSLGDLRALVDGAHERKMSVILDFIPNHTAWDHAWVSQHKDWYKQNAEGQLISPNGWLDVVQLDFTKQDLVDALIESMRYWVFAANVDGFRFDYAGGPPLEFWQQAVSSLRSINSHELLLLAEDGRNENFTTDLDYNFGFSFFEELHKVFNGADARKLDHVHLNESRLAGNDQRVVRYTTNHDVNASEGTPESIFGGDKGAMAAFVVSSYMRSTPMIYSGQEVGTVKPIAFPFTEDTIDWSINKAKTTQYADIIRVFNHNEALRKGSLESYSSNNVVAFTRTIEYQQAFVIVNPRGVKLDYALPESVADESWTDAFSGAALNLEASFTINAHDYRVFIRRTTP